MALVSKNIITLLLYNLLFSVKKKREPASPRKNLYEANNPYLRGCTGWKFPYLLEARTLVCPARECRKSAFFHSNATHDNGASEATGCQYAHTLESSHDGLCCIGAVYIRYRIAQDSCEITITASPSTGFDLLSRRAAIRDKGTQSDLDCLSCNPKQKSRGENHCDKNYLVCLICQGNCQISGN